GIDDLSLAQQAMIAGLPQRPSAYNPIVNPERARKRRDYVLSRMLSVGYIDQAEHDAAVAQPISASLYRPSVQLEAPYVAEMVRAYMERRVGDDIYTKGYRVFTTVRSDLQQAATDATVSALMAYDKRHGYRGPELQVDMNDGADNEQRLKVVSDISDVGGLKAALVVQVFDKEARILIPRVGEATIEWDGLSWARAFITEDRLGDEPKNAIDVVAPGDVIRVIQSEDKWTLAQIPKVEGALVSLRPDDGAVLALTGGFDFYRSKFNRAIQAERQPGSNFKPFVYSAALEAGFTPATLINDAPVVFDDPALETAWRPENYSGKFFGPTRLRHALAKSRNLVSIRILREIGIDYALKHVGRFGLDEQRLPRDLSLALGSGGLTPLEVAAGYSVFANGGFAVEPYFIERIEDRSGNIVARATPTVVCRDCSEIPENPAFTPRSVEETNLEDVTDPDAVASARIAPRVVPATNAWLMNSILRDVIRMGTATKAKALGRKDLAGKTGTTNDQRDAWFSGFSSRVATTAWVGFDKLDPLGRRETGGKAALPMWMTYMKTALEGTPDAVPRAPPGIVTRRVSRRTGQETDDAEEATITEYFRTRLPRRRIDNAQDDDKRGPVAGNNSSPPRRAPVKKTRAAQGATEKLF
ncbi:MAG: transglycosylase domain-containing protein, partial [Gammaproteobacteria bacterium]|nr:transglycosylase domain-containing protein [Gammaproteobacteria bacterium]